MAFLRKLKQAQNKPIRLIHKNLLVVSQLDKGITHESAKETKTDAGLTVEAVG
ncbi:MAG: hypothetical protein K9G46_04250 [Flavobacteriales bacterium]|nr:hypothetical protein [Flavobacteriales bacterium]